MSQFHVILERSDLCNVVTLKKRNITKLFILLILLPGENIVLNISRVIVPVRGSEKLTPVCQELFGTFLSVPFTHTHTH